MSTDTTTRSVAIRTLIQGFLDKDSAKKEKSVPTGLLDHPLTQQFSPTVWIADAARRVRKIQAVTHALKGIHSKAIGSSVYCDPRQLMPLDVVSSHCLGSNFDSDVVGNAAALDVYKFLCLPFEQRSLLSWMQDDDADVLAALSDDPEQAQEWVNAFKGLVADSTQTVSSHTLAKQVYWLVGDDPKDNRQYHLLAPLYPTSLAHHMYLTLEEHRFGESAKRVREAKKQGQYHEEPLRDYPQLAVQKLGGSNPQNISQLNCKRLGRNFLLASLPPQWHQSKPTPLWHTDTLFHRFGRQISVRHAVRALRHFLKKNPDPTMLVRDQRDELSDVLIEQFLIFRETHTQATAGWSLSPNCHLPDCEKIWLDKGALPMLSQIKASWADELSGRYAHWLNSQLGTTPEMRMGDAEYQHWQRDLREVLSAYEWELNHV